MSDTAPAARPWWLGLAVIVLGGVWLHGGLTLPQAGGYALIGPGVFVVIVGGTLLLLGVLMLLQIARGERFEPQGAEDVAERPASPVALALVVAGAALPLLTMRWLGFPLTAAAAFFVVTLAFGERRMVHSAVIGLALSHACFFGFGWLGVTLGGYLPLAGW